MFSQIFSVKPSFWKYFLQVKLAESTTFSTSVPPPSWVSIVSGSLDPPPSKSADVIPEQNDSCLMTFMTHFKSWNFCSTRFCHNFPTGKRFGKLTFLHSQYQTKKMNIPFISGNIRNNMRFKNYIFKSPISCVISSNSYYTICQ